MTSVLERNATGGVYALRAATDTTFDQLAALPSPKGDFINAVAQGYDDVMAGATTAMEMLQLDAGPRRGVITFASAGSGKTDLFAQLVRMAADARMPSMNMILVGAIGLRAPTPFMFVKEPTTGSRVPVDTPPPPAVTVQPPEPDVEAGPPAFTAFKEIGGWLSADDDRVAEMLGIGRTTHYAWKREQREPRARTARRVYEYHAVLDALRRRLGAGGLELWLRQGDPTRRDLLLAGRLDAVDRDVHAVLFDRPADQRPDLSWAPEQTDVQLDETSNSQGARRRGRRPRRARIS